MALSLSAVDGALKRIYAPLLVAALDPWGDLGEALLWDEGEPGWYRRRHKNPMPFFDLIPGWRLIERAAGRYVADLQPDECECCGR